MWKVGHGQTAVISAFSLWGMALCLLSIVYGAVGSSIESLPDGTRNGTVTFGGHEHMGASGVALVWMNQAEEITKSWEFQCFNMLQLVNMVNMVNMFKHPVYS